MNCLDCQQDMTDFALFSFLSHCLSEQSGERYSLSVAGGLFVQLWLCVGRTGMFALREHRL